MSTIAFYNGALGMKAFQSAMNVTAHNIANVNTTGYKAQRATFEDLVRTRVDTRVPGPNMVGHGVRQELVGMVFSQDGINQTRNSLDFAIAGDGFFMTERGGEIEFTRNGGFNLSVEGDDVLLVTDDGAYVLDADGNRIALEKDEDGAVMVDGLLDRIGVYTFPNLFGLEQRSGSRFASTEQSGDALLIGADSDKTVRVYQGALEFSAVDLAKEMTDVISFQRGFQLNSRVLQTADQIMQEINNLR